MRVQIVISGLLLDPGCNVGTNIFVNKLVLIFRFVNIFSRTNFILKYFFILLGGAGAVDWEYFVRLVIAAQLANCFVTLCTDLWLMKVSHYLERENKVNN